MSIRRLVQVLLGSLFVLAAVVAAVIVTARTRRNNLIALEQRRFESYRLAEELRHSSDDLTRFVRAYVATGDPRFRAYYNQVLAIRSGRAPRPAGYDGAYWDFVAAGDAALPVGGEAVPIDTLMIRTGFTREEMALLHRAEDSSTALVALEQHAMHAMRGEFPDASGRYTRRGRPDPALANRLVNDATYLRRKADIMRPIDEFLATVSARTTAELDEFRRQTRVAVLASNVALGAFILLLLISYPVMRLRILDPVRRLQQQTGRVASDLDRLAATARHIAEHDPTPAYAVATSPIRSTRRDEIGELSRTHDAMLQHLASTGASVASITAELSVARRRAETDLELSEQRYAAIFRENPVALLVAEQETGRLVAVNSAFLALCQLESEAQAIGRTTVELGFWAGDNHARVTRVTTRLAAGERVEQVAVPFRRRDGMLRTIESWASSYEVAGKRYSIGSLVDATDRLAAEEARRQAQAQYQELFEGMRDVVFSLTTDGRITLLNPSFEAVTGMPAAEWVGRPYTELIHPDDRVRASAQLKQSLTGTPPDAPPLRLKTRVGWALAEFRSAPRMEDGKVVGVFGIARDVSERASLEEQLRQSQKMEALGTLAGGIAHDFNNILTAINGNAQLAVEDVPDDHPARESLDGIWKAGQRARAMVKRILLFSRREASHKQSVALESVVAEVVALLRASLPRTIEIASAVTPGPTPVHADSSQVHQVLMNLGTNAGHAMGEKGTLAITLDLATPDEATAQAQGLGPGPHVRLVVRDTGVGMSPEILRRIFEPFFTTKGAGGTGLGLSVVHGIMRDHDGAIAVESEIGKGTAFTLYFPALANAARVSGAGEATRTRGSGQRVMLVDDEESLINVNGRILERLGYRCTGFTSPHAALQAFRERPLDFDAVMTDYSMPEMTGLDLARALRAIKPDLRIAMASGTGTEDERMRDPSIRVHITKPATIEEIAAGLGRLFTS